MELKERIKAFAELGTFFNQFSIESIEKNNNSEINTLFFDAFKMQIERAHESNGWFTKENVLFAIESLTKALTLENLEKWTSNYNFNEKLIEECIQ